jgi:site-specific recombinase XerD
MLLRYLERPEIDTLLVASRSHRAHLEPILAIMAFTGMRITETLTLRHEDVANLGVVSKVIRVHPDTYKRSRYRELPVPPVLDLILTRYLSRFTATYLPLSWLFPGPGGRPLTSRSVEIALKRLALNTLAKPVNPHMLRHSFATILARTAPIRVVQAALGHARLETTMIYTHTTQLDLSNAVAGAFNPPTPLIPEGGENEWTP